MEQENAKMLNAKGELSEENAITYEKLRKSYDTYSGVSLRMFFPEASI
jgi:regulator of nonsense transcripts 2